MSEQHEALRGRIIAAYGRGRWLAEFDALIALLPVQDDTVPTAPVLTDDEMWDIRNHVAINEVMPGDDSKAICVKQGRALEAAIMKVLKPRLAPDPKDMAVRFLSWPLPATLSADPCASDPSYPYRYGTNLMTLTEAEAMVEHILTAPKAPELVTP